MNTMWPKLDEGIAMFPGETKPVCSDSDLSIARGRKAYFGATESDGKNGKPAWWWWWWWWTLSLLCLSLSVSPSSFLFFLSLSLSLSFSSLISVSLFILPLTYLLFENVVWLKPSSSGSRCITWWASHRIWFLEGMPPKTVQTAQELEDKYGSGITKRGVSIKGSYI